MLTWKKRVRNTREHVIGNWAASSDREEGRTKKGRAGMSPGERLPVDQDFFFATEET